MKEKIIKDIFELIKRVGVKSDTLIRKNQDSILSSSNEHGDVQTRFDLEVNQLIIDEFTRQKLVKRLYSEELEQAILFENSPSNLEVFVDPLDGSKNVLVNGGVGTIFTIVHGEDVLAAAYIYYGLQTILLLAYQEVVEYSLQQGEFVLKKKHELLPKGNVLILGGYHNNYHQKELNILNQLLSTRPAIFYNHAFIVNLHQLITTGGIYIYPQTKAYPSGKLRLCYEAKAAAFIIEKMGGLATDGENRILDKKNKQQDKTPLFLGDKKILQSLFI